MTEQPTPLEGRRRFPLSWLFWLTLVSALGGLLIQRTSHTPTVPLLDKINEFNTRARSVPSDSQEPPISEAEVVAAIEARLATLPAHAATEYRRVVRTRRVPTTARIILWYCTERQWGAVRTLRRIVLDFPAANGEGLSLLIRATDKPATQAEHMRAFGSFLRTAESVGKH